MQEASSMVMPCLNAKYDGKTLGLAITASALTVCVVTLE